MDDDAMLMLSVKNGNDVAFDQLMERYKRPLLNFVFRMVNNAALAEEIAQDVFVRVYLARERYAPTARFSTWLFTVAINTTRKHLRQSWRWVPLTTETEEGTSLVFPEPTETSPDALAALISEEERERIRMILADLPEKERMAITLNQYNGYSYQEIADMMRCSLAAIKTHIFRGKLRLKRLLLSHERQVENGM